MARPWAVSCVTMPRSSTPRAPKLKNAQPFTRTVLAWSARGGYERGPCASAGVLRPGNGQRATCNGGVGPGGEARPEERQTSLEVQSGSDGIRGADMRGENAEVPRMPSTTGVQDGQKPCI